MLFPAATSPGKEAKMPEAQQMSLWWTWSLDVDPVYINLTTETLSPKFYWPVLGGDQPVMYSTLNSWPICKPALRHHVAHKHTSCSQHRQVPRLTSCGSGSGNLSTTSRAIETCFSHSSQQIVFFPDQVVSIKLQLYDLDFSIKQCIHIITLALNDIVPTAMSVVLLQSFLCLAPIMFGKSFYWVKRGAHNRYVRTIFLFCWNAFIFSHG